MVEEFGFNKFQITTMLAWWSVAYGIGQLVNGLLCESHRRARLDGYRRRRHPSPLIWFTDSRLLRRNFLYLRTIWLLNGYVQSFGRRQ